MRERGGGVGFGGAAAKLVPLYGTCQNVTIKAAHGEQKRSHKPLF